jgi:hypothetical protein
MTFERDLNFVQPLCIRGLASLLDNAWPTRKAPGKLKLRLQPRNMTSAPNVC